MSKKTQVIQLQTEVNTDEDWEKLLQKDGLIVVDIYSEWCGPCSGMTATLKKLKLEIGGDLLQLAIAKSDHITALERFRNKSEPTWMFIVNGKMVNFMFGANAPKLIKLITDELKREQDARQGRRERVQMEIEELAEEERERYEVIENLKQAALEREIAKAAKDLHERRVAECNNILDNLIQFGVIIIFPHARTMYHDAFGDLLGEAGLIITLTEKIIVTEQQLEELFYFTENPFPEDAMEELLSDTSHILLVKPIPSRDVTELTDDLLREICYGKSCKPPGDKDSPAKILEKFELVVDEEEPPEQMERVGLWVPMNDLEKATALRLFFRSKAENFLIPEPEPEPPHYAVIYDAYRRHEIQELMEKYQDEILRLGFFTSEVPEEAEVIAKSIKHYEKHVSKGPATNDKLVLQLSKKRSECILAFVSTKPQYISPNAVEGKRECQIFFPDDYDEPPSVEEVVEEEEEEEGENGEKKKKKKKKKRKKRGSQIPGSETTVGSATSTASEYENESEGAQTPRDSQGEVIPGEILEGTEPVAPPEPAVASEEPPPQEETPSP